MKTCNENDTFKSVGTIQVKCNQGGKQELLFTPNAEHSASDGVKKYAVFFPTCKCTDGVATALCKSRQSLEISLCGFDKLSELVAAATQRTAVEVEVPDENGKPVWNLKSITIPATRTKK